MSTYDFPVTGFRVVDGDTYHLTVVVRPGTSAFRVTVGDDTAEPEIRLNGYDTPEKRSSATRVVAAYERAAAALAQLTAQQWLGMLVPAGRVRVQTEPDPEKYGRWLGRIYSTDGPNDGDDLGAYLASLSLAVPYDGTSKTRRWWEVYAA